MRRTLFRPFMESPEASPTPPYLRLLKSPLFAWARLRPVFAQHSLSEDRALRRWAHDRSTVVEIGVAEGGSAIALIASMGGSGSLYLIDPFHLSRFKWINSPKRAAHAALAAAVRKSSVSRQGVTVAWIEDFSSRVAERWTQPIDFLFIDGDHDETAVLRDWENWNKFVVPRGIVAFHDARVFPGGWTATVDGPVRVVNSLFRQKKIEGWKIVEEVHSLVILEKTEP
jgi:predicted O-methyltransferase YrrM